MKRKKTAEMSEEWGGGCGRKRGDRKAMELRRKSKRQGTEVDGSERTVVKR